MLWRQGACRCAGCLERAAHLGVAHSGHAAVQHAVQVDGVGPIEAHWVVLMNTVADGQQAGRPAVAAAAAPIPGASAANATATATTSGGWHRRRDRADTLHFQRLRSHRLEHGVRQQLLARRWLRRILFAATVSVLPRPFLDVFLSLGVVVKRAA